MAASTLEPVVERGWRCGLRNLLRLENQRWWGTRRWWVQSLVLLVLLNGLLAFGLWIDPLIETVTRPPGYLETALDIVLMWMSILTVLVTIFVAQDALVGEKQSGLAAWVLSGPVSRPAYLLSKFLAHGLGLLSTAVFLQGLVAYLQASLLDGRLRPLLPWLAALALQALYVLFYLALVLWLGAVFTSRLPVLLTAFGVLLGQPLVEFFTREWAPGLAWLFPSKLPELARFAQRAEAWPSVVPAVAAVAYVAVFLWLAVRRFEREEF